MDTLHPRPLRGKHSLEVIIPDTSNNLEPKLKAPKRFVRNSVVFYPTIYLYYDELNMYNLIKRIHRKFCTLYLWENISSYKQEGGYN